MIIVFIHLSDFHFKNREDSLEEKARLAVRAVRTAIGEEEAWPIVLITGDLAYHGKAEEYAPMRLFIDTLLISAKEEFGQEAVLAMVPGNHDVLRPWETLDDLAEMFEVYSGRMDEFYRDELKCSSAFFAFADQYGIPFDYSNGTHVTEINVGTDEESVSLRLVSLSSSPCSTLEREQGRHYLPDSAISCIPSDSKPGELSPYTAVLLHHPINWYEDTTRLKLCSALRAGADLFFTGHEHMEDAHEISSQRNAPVFVSSAGEFARDDWLRCTFNSVLMNTKSHVIVTERYLWDPKSRLFFPSNSAAPKSIVYPKGSALHPLTSFIAEMSKSDDSFFGPTFLDYFQFPMLFEDKTIDKPISRHKGFVDSVQLNEFELFEKLTSARVINIYGQKNAGRTTLLKYLYLKCLERGFSPVYLKREVAHKTFGVTFSGIVRNQYGDSDTILEAFKQQDKNKSILFIDDFHLLKKGPDPQFLVDALKSVGKVVVVTNHPLVIDGDGGESVLSMGTELTTVRIGKFTKSGRDELIQKVCSAKGVSVSVGDEMALTITRTVSEYHYMFPLNPGFVLQYLRYALEKADVGEILLCCEKPFGEVYQSNIERLLERDNPTADAGYTLTNWKKLGIAILGLIAYRMHEARKDSISSEVAVKSISEHLNDFGIDNVSPGKVFESIVGSQILVIDDDGKYYFRNSNHLAYFIAFDISRRLEYSAGIPDGDMTAKADIDRILDEVGYGINETIILFLSYLRESVFIPLEISERGVALVSDVEQAEDMSFVRQDTPVDLSMPGEEDRRVAIRLADESEESNAADDTFLYRGLYDYEADSKPSPIASIPLATKYLELVGRILSSNYLRIQRADKDTIVSQMYETLGKVIGLIESEFCWIFDEIVDDYADKIDSGDQRAKSEFNKISKLYTGMLLGLSIGLMAQVANSMTDDNAIAYVGSYETNTPLQGIFQLMLFANHSLPQQFCDCSCKLRKDAHKRNKYADELAIMFIVAQYIINHPHLSSSLLDKLAIEVFGGKSKKFLAGMISSKENAKK